MEEVKIKRLEEKKTVALISVAAAIFLTGFKLIVGLLTGSLGIISEALHSGLDLVAAAITYISVRVSDKPPDFDHNFGHGKIENLSAFIQTILLFITCAWIVYEAVSRLSTGKFEIEVNLWSYVVVVSSIIIDFHRSRALSRAAKKHNSQALEADALHFSTDIWSSSVVLLGLILAQFDFHIADPIAALGVAVIVLVISFRLGKRSIDILMDKSPKETQEKVNSILRSVEGILRFHDVKVRTAGPYTFIELNIHVEPLLTIDEAHELSHKVEAEIKNIIGNCEVHIHAEPEKENDR